MTPQTKNGVRSPLIVYGHDYCPQAQLVAKILATHKIAHEWRDIRLDEPLYQTELKRLTGGNLSVPTVVFPDGTVMIEPWPNQILKKLGLKKPGLLERLYKWFKP